MGRQIPLEGRMATAGGDRPRRRVPGRRGIRLGHGPDHPRQRRRLHGRIEEILMRYRWPDGQQCARRCCRSTSTPSQGSSSASRRRSRRSLAGLEERRFGPRVGVDRILRMLDQPEAPGDVLHPGWTVENHSRASAPDQGRRPRDRRPRQHARGGGRPRRGAGGGRDAARSSRILADQLGVRPAGYRSPSWDVNVWTPGILKRHGFLYDSSLMGNDVPYHVPRRATGPLIEVPVQWILDDAPLFRHVYGAANVIADPARVLQTCGASEFAAIYRGERLLRADLPPLRDRARLPDHAAGGAGGLHPGFPGVWFTTGEAIARWHEEGSRAGTEPRPTPAPGARRLSPRRRPRARRRGGTAGSVATPGAGLAAPGRDGSARSLRPRPGGRTAQRHTAPR